MVRRYSPSFRNQFKQLTVLQITKAGVPSNKVVVGVTSYGRSFAMSKAGCDGPECTYLGSAGVSQATPGECTQTAGYISNAEINAIINNSSRVNKNFIDPTSHSNILVYDDTQWVGWMDDSVKSSRMATYKGLAMGGITDWATDLQKYNDAPPRAGSWAKFLADVKVGTDPGNVSATHAESLHSSLLTISRLDLALEIGRNSRVQTYP